MAYSRFYAGEGVYCYKLTSPGYLCDSCCRNNHLSLHLPSAEELFWHTVLHHILDDGVDEYVLDDIYKDHLDEVNLKNI